MDHCVTLSREMQASRVANVWGDPSIVVDDETARNYALREPWSIPVTRIYGFNIARMAMTQSLKGMQGL